MKHLSETGAFFGAGRTSACARFSTMCVFVFFGAAAAHALVHELHARASGIMFRAVGYGPSWSLETDRDGGVRFVVDGADAVIYLSPPPGIDTRMEASGIISGSFSETRELLIDILHMTCMDAVSGERLTHTVTVRLDGREHRGCGRAFEDVASAH